MQLKWSVRFFEKHHKIVIIFWQWRERRDAQSSLLNCMGKSSLVQGDAQKRYEIVLASGQFQAPARELTLLASLPLLQPLNPCKSGIQRHPVKGPPP
jgi:hypothetical protein